jgi:hypothetical protein
MLFVERALIGKVVRVQRMMGFGGAEDLYGELRASI